LNPQIVIEKIEIKTPFLLNRLNAIYKLQNLGFSVGLRFDPIISFEGFEKEYSDFFSLVFSNLDITKIHSITLGSVRFPFSYFANMIAKNINFDFLASIKGRTKNRICYQNEKDILKFCKNEILKYLQDEKKIFVHLG